MAKTWSQCPLEGFHSLPVMTLEKVEEDVYAGTAGAGIFKFSSGINFVGYESRFNTQNGLNVGKWFVNSIIEDESNRNRVIAATQGQGVLECINATGNTESIKWNFDIRGLPYGNITIASMIYTNPAIILAGVENDGMYRKDPLTGIYEKSTNGLPITGNLKQVFIDREVNNIYISFVYIHTGGKELLVLRSSIKTPEIEPDQEVAYQQGYTIGNADIIYIGDGNFTNGIYKDVSKKLRNNDPYYYRFYEKDGTDYSEINTYTGDIQSKIGNTMEFNVYHDGDSFTGVDLSGRIVCFNSGRLNEQRYKIVSNTTNTFTIQFDPLKEINKGYFDSTDFRGINYKIESTFVYYATMINPIYIVFEDCETKKGQLYYSENNGIDWINIEFQGVFVFSVPSINSLLVLPVMGYAVTVNARIFYVATDSNVLRSHDNGRTWDILSTDEHLYDGSPNTYYNGLPNITNPDDGYVKILDRKSVV